MLNRLLNVCQRVLHTAGEHMRAFPESMRLCGGNRLFGGFRCADALERRGFDHCAAQRRAEFDKIDDISVFADDVDHV